MPNLELIARAPDDELPALARRWAEAVWDAWRPHHEQVRAWNLELVPHRVR